MSDEAPGRDAVPLRSDDEVGWVSVPPGAPADTQRFVPGATIGRYELLGLIATGGMAAVYLARAVGTTSPLLAIKRIHPHLGSDENFGRMFQDEARVATLLHHRNVVPTHGLEDLGAPCIVMDYVDGDQLRRFMQSPGTPDGRIPAPVALRIACDMLRGLHAAHELTDTDGTPLEVVHRDVSPQNVLVGRDGVTRVTDFGIARAKGRLAVTREGLVRGKLRYMAPEQATPRETPPDRRADVFAAGIIVWEMITGRRLFRGDEATVVQKLLHLPIPRPREMRGGIDESLDMALMGSLERELDVRYHNAAEFADALESAAARGTGIASDADVAAFVEAVMGPAPETPGSPGSPGSNAELDAGPGTDVEVMLSVGTIRRSAEAPAHQHSWPANAATPARPTPMIPGGHSAEALDPPVVAPDPPAVVEVPAPVPAPAVRSMEKPSAEAAAAMAREDEASRAAFLRPAVPAWGVGLIALAIAAMVAALVRSLFH